MEGITQENFINLCQRLLDCISNRKKNNNDEGEKFGINIDEAMILQTANEIVDSSNGFIQTENEELKTVFIKVFKRAGNIIRAKAQSSHYKRLMREGFNKNDDDKLAEASEFFIFSHKILLVEYDETIKACKEALEYSKAKGM